MARTEIQGVKIPFTYYFLPKIGSCVGLLNFINKCGSGEWRTDCDMADQSLTYRAVVERGVLKWGEYNERGRASLENNVSLCRTHHDDLLQSRTFKNVVKTSDGGYWWKASDLVEVMQNANKAVKNG